MDPAADREREEPARRRWLGEDEVVASVRPQVLRLKEEPSDLRSEGGSPQKQAPREGHFRNDCLRGGQIAEGGNPLPDGIKNEVREVTVLKEFDIMLKFTKT